MTATPATVLVDLSERQWQAQVVELVTMLDWRHFHDLRAKGSDPGWPDLFLLRERPVWVELKSETGRLRPAQTEWLRLLDRAGCEAYLARPSHLDLLAAVLSCRGNPYDKRGRPRDAAAELRAQTMQALDPKGAA